MRFLTLLLPGFAMFLVTAHADELVMAKPESVGMSSQQLERVSEFASRSIERGHHSGMVTMIARRGKVVHFEAAGQLGVENDTPMEKDTLFRIFSMTKPITSVAMMMLYEEGKFQLNDPVTKHLPEFANLKVLVDGELVEPTSPMLIQHLFTHSSGLSYGFYPGDPVDQQYQAAEIWASEDLDEFVDKIATLPLRFHPGEHYFYSVATDILGALIERLSGQSLEIFFQQRIFDPLGMHDTFFSVPEDKRHRFADNHVWNFQENRMDPQPDRPGGFTDATLFSGGGGLVSTAMDYMRFCELLRRGGSFNGVRLLGPKTVQFMRIGHLSDGITHGGPPGLADTLLYPGQNFGLGFAVIEEPGLSQVVSSKGEYSWGGAADTKFWLDPEEDLVAILMTQLMLSPHETRYQMKIATYQALAEISTD